MQDGGGAIIALNAYGTLLCHFTSDEFEVLHDMSLDGAPLAIHESWMH